jgi:predicted dinucleotide-binding enzyme
MTVFGVIGGYGTTGSVVASELRKRGDEVLIGGRDAARACVSMFSMRARWTTSAAVARSSSIAPDR